MATQTYKNLYQDSTTTEGAQTNKTTEGAQTNTTEVGARTDTVSNTTTGKADTMLNKAYGTTANYGTAQGLGYSTEQLDRNKLLALYEQAAKTNYDVANQEYGQAINQYGNSLRNAQDSYIQAMRQANANAIASGAARGTRAANELSTILGLQQQGVQGATELAQERANLGLDYAKALSEAQVNAEDEAFNRRQATIDQLLQKYASDSDILAYLGYGGLADYLGNNTDQITKTGKQTTTEKTGNKTTIETLGGKNTTTKYK